MTIRRVSQRHSCGVPSVPCVFGHAYLLLGGFCGEWRKWRPIHFQFLYVRAERIAIGPPKVSARDSATRESGAHPASHLTAENVAGVSNWLLMPSPGSRTGTAAPACALARFKVRCARRSELRRLDLWVRSHCLPDQRNDVAGTSGGALVRDHNPNDARARLATSDRWRLGGGADCRRSGRFAIRRS